MAQQRKDWGKRLLAVMVLVLLAMLSAINLKIPGGPLWRFVRHDIGFENFADEVQQRYLSDSFVSKHYFVNLNGLFARLTGRRTLNNVVKLNNGVLSEAVNDINMASLANGLVDFSDYLNNQNIPFLYVQMSYKESLDGRSFPEGVSTYGNKNADGLLSQLSAEGIKTLDLRPLLAQTPEMLEQYFYKTDHHWNADGAFVAFREILNYLYELFPDGNIDLTYAQTDQWERHSIDDWFLGSRGKRVGIYFGGTDPLIWYTPKFETEMSCSIPKNGSLFRGDFTAANIREKYIEKKNYFGDNSYCVYIGGDYPLVQHRNRNAPSPLKVMMIKDSFSLPLQAYLSTVFQEIDVVDPRHFSECTVAEYVERTDPDVVILGMNPSSFTTKAYRNLWMKEAFTTRAAGSIYKIATRQDIEVAAEDEDDQDNYTAYPLEPNTAYRVSFSGVDILEGQTEGVGLRLCNKTTGAVLENAIFDLSYCEAANGFSWICRTPDTQDEFELLFYAGIYGSTAGNGVVYRNVILEKS